MLSQSELAIQGISSTIPLHLHPLDLFPSISLAGKKYVET